MFVDPAVALRGSEAEEETSAVSTPTDNPQDEGDAEPQENRPVLRVITPDATPEEVAALVAVLAAAGGGEPPSPRRRPEWNAPHRQVRRPHAAGPGAWRASGLPGA